MKVLFLAAWYPNRFDAMEGLFIRKHATAVGQYTDVHVLFLKEHHDIGKAEYASQRFENITEHYVYYPEQKSKIGKLKAFIRYYRLGFKHVCQEWGKPDLIHVNVLTRHGAVALFLKKFCHIPYVVTEHWTRYHREPFRNKAHKRLTQAVARNAERIMPVCLSLQKAMEKFGLSGHYTVVYNVVDDFFFQPGLPPSRPVPPVPESPESAGSPVSRIKTMIHICCFFEETKNNFGLLDSLQDLNKKRQDFRIVFVGCGKDWERTKEHAYKQLKLSEKQVLFIGEKDPGEVKKAIDASDFMVLFSNFENAPVVLSENFACGKPAVSSNVGGISEYLGPKNGLLVPARDGKQLCAALDWMLDHYQEYDADAIRQDARVFSFEEVGKKLFGIYQECCPKAAKG